MPNPDLKRKLMGASMFVLPVVVVKLSTTFLLGPAPQAADASAVEPAPVATPTTALPAKWTPKQLAAVKHLATRNSEAFGPTPLLVEKTPEPEPEPEPPPIPLVVVEPPKIKPDPKLLVHAVMSGARGRTAVIDGRPYSEGDRIRDHDWILVVIDTNSRSVTIEEMETGRRKTILVELPLMQQ